MIRVVFCRSDPNTPTSTNNATALSFHPFTTEFGSQKALIPKSQLQIRVKCNPPSPSTICTEAVEFCLLSFSCETT
eukprot:1908978-Rhodomonas_salina.2